MVKNVRNVVGTDFRGNSMAWKGVRVNIPGLLRMAFIDQKCYEV